MVDFAVLPAFITASLVIILSPGADTFLLLRYAIRGGRAAGFRSMSGILIGLSLVSLLLISGVGLLVSRVPIALDILTFLGIGILVFLALTSVRAGMVLLKTPVLPSGAPVPEKSQGLDAPLRMSLITNVTNPKVLIFYIAFFPQFLGQATSVVWQLSVLSVAFLIISTLWLVPLVFLASSAKEFFTRPTVAVMMEFSVATVFILLAIFLIVTM